MFRLFQSIFGAKREPAGRWPEELVDMAIERAVDGTDPRLRALSGYRDRLREPTIALIDHIVRLVDELPAPVAATAENYREDACLRCMFASPERMFEVLARDQNLDGALRAGAPGGQPLTALLMVQINEKRTLGIDVEDGVQKRDVQITVVSFDGHHLVDPCTEESETRRLLKRRAFDHILAQALAAMVARRTRRSELAGQHRLLRRKLTALQRAGWSFDDGATHADAATLEDEIAGIAQELEALGPDAVTLDVHLDMLAEALAAPQRSLWSEERSLILDHRNVLRAQPDSVARELTLRELYDASGGRRAVLLLSVLPDLLPRTDFFAAAKRYTG